MKLNKEEAHEYFKDVKVAFSSLEDCEKIQKKLFEAGYNWFCKNVVYTDCMYVYTDAGSSISRGHSVDSFGQLPQKQLAVKEVTGVEIVEVPTKWKIGDTVKVENNIGTITGVHCDKYVISSGSFIANGGRVIGRGPSEEFEAYEKDVEAWPAESPVDNSPKIYQPGTIIVYTSADGRHYKGTVVSYAAESWTIEWADTNERTVVTDRARITPYQEKDPIYWGGDEVEVSNGNSSFIGLVRGRKMKDDGTYEYYVINEKARVTGWYAEDWIKLINKSGNRHIANLPEICRAFCWGRCKSKEGCSHKCADYSRFVDALKNTDSE